MLAVLGHFRLPNGSLDSARDPMREVIAASLAEPGCRAYSYAEDVSESGLFRVTELWDTREALEAHFQTAHMRQWQKVRDSLGFYDRQITVYEIASGSVEL